MEEGGGRRRSTREGISLLAHDLVTDASASTIAIDAMLLRELLDCLVLLQVLWTPTIDGFSDHMTNREVAGLLAIDGFSDQIMYRDKWRERKQ